jgi:ribonuclease HI
MQGESTAPTIRGSVKVTRQIASIQRAGALAISGGLRTSPSDTLDALTYLLPAALTIDKVCHRAYTRLTMLPADHPLFPLINSGTVRRVKRHRAPIHNLRNLYDHEPRRIEKIPSAARDPAQIGKLPFEISIAESRSDSIEEAGNAEEEIQIFTDGSSMEGRVGAAAITLQQGKITSALHFHLGPDTEHTVHEAELVGILLAIHIIDKEAAGSITFAIGVDNQAAMKIFSSDLRIPGQHLAREILRRAAHAQKKKGKANRRITLRWTAGHEGIEGNEMADEEAKKAAKGLTSDKPSLPSYLRKELLINPAAVRQKHNEKLKKIWSESWRKSDRGSKLATLDVTTPSKGFLKRISNAKLDRKAASVISQLIISHVPLNAYLARFKKVDNARCPACGALKEDIVHFLLTCPSYAYERWKLKQQVKKKKKPFTLQTLLVEPDLTIPLANFIDETKRFKQPN